MRIFLLILSVAIISPLMAHDSINRQLSHEATNDVKVYKIPSMVLSISLPQDNFIRTFIAQSKKQAEIYPITPNTLFQVGSITKLYLSVLLLKLQQDGDVTINNTIAQTVSKYGYWAPKKLLNKWKNIKLKQLLNMTSGIYSYTDSAKLIKEVYKAPHKQWSSIELLNVAYDNKAYFKAGDNWHYSNTNYILLGMLISKIEKKPLSEIFNDLFAQDNLNLLNTFYPNKNLALNLQNRLVPGYDSNNKDVKAINLSIAGSSGAIISDSVDLVRFIRIVFNGDYLNKKQLKLLESVVSTKNGKSIHKPTKQSGLYGLGIFRAYSPLAGAYWIYEGKTFGYQAEVVWVPDYNLVFSITLNKAYPEKSDPFDSITDHVFDILLHKKHKLKNKS